MPIILVNCVSLAANPVFNFFGKDVTYERYRPDRQHVGVGGRHWAVDGELEAVWRRAGHRRRAVRRYPGWPLCPERANQPERGHAALYPGVWPDPVRLHHRHPGRPRFLLFAARLRSAAQRLRGAAGGDRRHSGGGGTQAVRRAAADHPRRVLRRGHQHPGAGRRSTNPDRSRFRSGAGGRHGDGLRHGLSVRHMRHPAGDVADPAVFPHQHRA
ncbi:Uncharacterised protein [Serratia marcescens]|uniref:Uncharacterized protein n=1 Tax=Serratia marcescens TaxID=615 RepID=A0A379Y7T9_SERMA|nr:Uncharacterised protein [Serratia marcescens]